VGIVRWLVQEGIREKDLGGAVAARGGI
jgi:hypothetical protein